MECCPRLISYPNVRSLIERINELGLEDREPYHKEIQSLRDRMLKVPLAELQQTLQTETLVKKFIGLAPDSLAALIFGLDIKVITETLKKDAEFSESPMPDWIDLLEEWQASDDLSDEQRKLTEKHYPNLLKLEGEDVVKIVEDLQYYGYFLRDVRRELALSLGYSHDHYPEYFNKYSEANLHFTGFRTNSIFILMFAFLLWCLCWFTVDVNLTSIHGLYRDRLASAFLVGEDTEGAVDIEKDLDLAEICCHAAGSTAPYHLINVALNLQGSKDLGLRDRQSDYFIFSKKFTGGERTAYCRSETLEVVFPQISLSTAMAVSAAAASPNMGRGTSPALVAIMTLLNIRLGYWTPNPGSLETWLCKQKGAAGKKGGYKFNEVFEEELIEVTRRWEQLPNRQERSLSLKEGDRMVPTPAHHLFGISFSGGGIRSATVNLGITQELHRRGIFDHADYMSTVSGGGYLGSSISALMRSKTKTVSEIPGKVRIMESESGEKIVSIIPPQKSDLQAREYRYAPYANIVVKDGDKVKVGDRLLGPGKLECKLNNSISAAFSWRIRPGVLLREVVGKLDETYRWVNVSDGGHIENLAAIELLRRHCKYILIGDGEADPNHHFQGMATLIRSARIDLGVEIDIDLTALRLGNNRLSKSHWAVGRINYPGHSEHGILLYLKSSVTGDEDEVIQEYRHNHQSFPHESTADQFFDEGQFEAYRDLGEHIAEHALRESGVWDGSERKITFSDFENLFQALYENAWTPKA